jgi:hypothetical protein
MKIQIIDTSSVYSVWLPTSLEWVNSALTFGSVHQVFGSNNLMVFGCQHIGGNVVNSC